MELLEYKEPIRLESNHHKDFRDFEFELKRNIPLITGDGGAVVTSICPIYLRALRYDKKNGAFFSDIYKIIPIIEFFGGL